MASTGQAQRTRRNWAWSVILGVLLMLVWVLWSGYFKPLLLGLGVFSSALVVYLAHRMQLRDSDATEPRFLWRLTHYWGWLAWQVLRSSLEVTRVVLSPKLPISPTVTEFDTRCSRPLDQAILGNSITLTPGTLTIQLTDGHFVVHALTGAGARDVADGEMERRVVALRGD